MKRFIFGAAIAAILLAGCGEEGYEHGPVTDRVSTTLKDGTRVFFQDEYMNFDDEYNNTLPLKMTMRWTNPLDDTDTGFSVLAAPFSSDYLFGLKDPDPSEGVPHEILLQKTLYPPLFSYGFGKGSFTDKSVACEIAPYDAARNGCFVSCLIDGEVKSAVAGRNTDVTFAIRIRDRSGHTYYRPVDGAPCYR